MKDLDVSVACIAPEKGSLALSSFPKDVQTYFKEFPMPHWMQLLPVGEDHFVTCYIIGETEEHKTVGQIYHIQQLEPFRCQKVHDFERIFISDDEKWNHDMYVSPEAKVFILCKRGFDGIRRLVQWDAHTMTQRDLLPLDYDIPPFFHESLRWVATILAANDTFLVFRSPSHSTDPYKPKSPEVSFAILQHNLPIPVWNECTIVCPQRRCRLETPTFLPGTQHILLFLSRCGDSFSFHNIHLYDLEHKKFLQHDCTNSDATSIFKAIYGPVSDLFTGNVKQ